MTHPIIFAAIWEIYINVGYYGLVIAVICVFLFFVFIVLHSIQHIDDPAERLQWVAILIGTTVFGMVAYIFLKYKDFYKAGKGGLIYKKKVIKNPNPSHDHRV